MPYAVAEKSFAQILERLDNEIEHERARIRILEDDEQNMLKHHARAASYVRS